MFCYLIRPLRESSERGAMIRSLLLATTVLTACSTGARLDRPDAAPAGHLEVAPGVAWP
jgi:hypothetical protein